MEPLKKSLEFFTLIILIELSLAAKNTAAIKAEPFACVTPDSLIIKGELYFPDSLIKPAPIVVLLHMMGHNISSWQILIPALIQKGYAVCAYDLRGHGQSVKRKNTMISFQDFLNTDFALYVNDLVSVLQVLSKEKKRINTDLIAIVGASIGANVALVTAADARNVRTVLLLSPGLDYRGIKPLPSLIKYSDRPIFLAASEGDSYSAQAVRKLAEEAAGPKLIKLYPGTAHGTDLFGAVKDFNQTLLAWLQKFLPVN